MAYFWLFCARSAGHYVPKFWDPPGSYDLGGKKISAKNFRAKLPIFCQKLLAKIWPISDKSMGPNWPKIIGTSYMTQLFMAQKFSRKTRQSHTTYYLVQIWQD